MTLRAYTLAELEKLSAGARAGVLDAADAAQVEAIAAARASVGAVNRWIGVLLTDADPMRELAQCDRVLEEWREKRRTATTRSGVSPRDAFNFLENAARNCNLARSIGNIAGEVTFTAAVSDVGSATARELASPLSSPVLRPLFLVGGAVLALVLVLPWAIRRVFS